MDLRYPLISRKKVHFAQPFEVQLASFCYNAKVMSVSIQDVEHVMKLARLGLTETEKLEFTEQLNTILEYATRLDQLNTEGIPPTSHSLPLKNVMREDRLTPWPHPEVIVKGAPEEEAGFFRVSRIL